MNEIYLSRILKLIRLFAMSAKCKEIGWAKIGKRRLIPTVIVENMDSITLKLKVEI